jgi:tetratricopeptide (TPR) repeat protein
MTDRSLSTESRFRIGGLRRPRRSDQGSPTRSCVAFVAITASLFVGFLASPTSTAAAAFQSPPAATDEPRVPAPDLRLADDAFRHGRYDEALEQARRAVAQGIWNERWYLLAIRAEATVGNLEAARETVDKGLSRYASSIQLRWLGVGVARRLGEIEQAERWLEEIETLLEASAWRYTDRANRIVAARFLLSRGVDPKSVLESLLDRVKEQDARYVDAYLVTAELALSKQDAAMASDELAEAIELDPESAEAHWMLGVAFAPTDAARAVREWSHALAIDPNFVPCLLSLVDRAIDAEDRDGAAALLDRVEAVDARRSELWAYRAVLAYLAERKEEGDAFRARALADWEADPDVDHLIGRKLSQKYRFADGIDHQRRALTFDPSHRDAALQLGQDLLRSGDAEGWSWIEKVRLADPYQVTAYNLIGLRDELASFETLERDGFVVRMTRREATLYGEEVLNCLSEARRHYESKYAVAIAEPILVEIFSRPSDFAVRTFGVPGVSGYLGVCFGNLITVNGPAAQNAPLSSWESVLWHEFGHTATLQKCRHRIPRWLGEGISVYEERLRDSGWGRRAGAADRRRILAGGLVPVSRLSEAFLRPGSPADLDFAYLEASWVVEYLIAERDLESLLGALDDLAAGISIDEALSRRWGSPEFLDAAFERYARERAEAEGLIDLVSSDAEPSGETAAREVGSSPGGDGETPTGDDDESSPASPGERSTDAANEAASVTEPGTPEDEGESPDASDVRSAEDDAESLRQLRREAEGRFAIGDWQGATEAFRELDERLPPEIDRRPWLGPWSIAARRSGDVESEWDVIARRIDSDADDVDALTRGCELALERSDFERAWRWGTRRLGVDPLSEATHRDRAAAAEGLGRAAEAIVSLRRMREFPVTNSVLLRYRLATQLMAAGNDDQAEQELIELLAEAPRFRRAWASYEQLRTRRERNDAPPRDDDVSDSTGTSASDEERGK